MAVIVNGDGILSGVSSLTTDLTDITSGRGTVTGVATVGTLQLGAGVSISSPRTQNAAIFTNNTEFLTVDDAGRVGVGTVTPNSDAHPQNVGKINVGFITARSIAGDIDANTMVVAGISTFVGALNATSVVSSGAVSGTTGTFSGDVSIAQNIVHTGDTDTNISFPSADTIRFDTGGATRLTLTGGNIVQQSGTLFIKNASSDSNGLKISQESSNESRIFNHYSGPITFGIANTEKLRVDSSGRLLIGHTSSQQSTSMLQVSRANNSTIRVASSDSTATNYAALDLAPANSIAGAQVAAVAVGTFGSTGAETAYLKFSTRNAGTTTEKMRITAGGAVQIGGETANSADIDASNTKLTIKQSANAKEDGIYIERSGERRGFYIYMGGALSTSDSLSITTNQLGGDVDVMAIDRGGDVKIGAGDLIFTTAGKGVVLGATSNTDANTLDDYEEGTFSGTASAAGYSGGSAIALLDEQYTKIGRTVHFNCRLQVASNLSDGDLTLSGLPFSASQDSVVDFSWQDAAGFNGGQGKISGTTCVRFNGTFPTHSSGTANIIFSGTYITAS